jgi:alditol oxidase
VNLGALGPVVRLSLDVEPTYDVRQDVYDDVAVAADELLDALAAADSVSLFTDLTSERFTMAWLKRRVGPAGDLAPAEPGWRSGVLAPGQRHPVPGQPAVGTTAQGTSGPWHHRLPHFRLDVPPSSRGAELQSEFLVPREHGPGAVEALTSIRALAAPLLQIAEVRSVAADDLWLSPAYQRNTVALHLTWRPDPAAVRAVLAVLEPLLEPLGARPHWGKVFVSAPDLVRSLYPRLPDFARLAARLDPEGRFRNPFVDAFVPVNAS